MNLTDELALSYYKPVANLAEGHSVQLVQHTETKKLFVRKHLHIYHYNIYQSLQSSPVRNIPQIELLVEDDTGLTVIEEYIPGDTLQEQMERTGPMPEEQVMDYTLQLCQIVSDLHHRTPAIIHRDIKPSNVIVSPDGIIKLLDMNAAKYATPNQSRDTTLLGTAGFAAPEQYGFAPSGEQSDLYAIGVLMNVLVTGKLPTEKIAGGKLAAIIKRCIELDPANRYSSVDELMLALRHIQTGAPLQANGGNVRTWRKFLPPGFRSGSVFHMILAVLGYVFLFAVGLCIEIENATPLVLALNRITVILIGLAIVFFTTNYCGIQARLPLARSRLLIIRIVGIVLYDIIIAFMLITILTMVEAVI